MKSIRHISLKFRTNFLFIIPFLAFNFKKFFLKLLNIFKCYIFFIIFLCYKCFIFYIFHSLGIIFLSLNLSISPFQNFHGNTHTHTHTQNIFSYIKEFLFLNLVEESSMKINLKVNLKKLMSLKSFTTYHQIKSTAQKPTTMELLVGGYGYKLYA